MEKTRDRFISFYYQRADILPEVPLIPEKTALLIVDMQNEFVHLNYGESELFRERGEWDRWVPYFDRLHQTVIPNTKQLLEKFRANQIEVTYGRIGCHKENGNDRSAVQKTPGWNGMLIPINSFGAQMIEGLEPVEDEIVVSKTTDSVLAGTNYSQLIRNMGIETVVVTGIVTDQCVASTVRDLADEGYKVIVVEDCCAAATMELHNAELTIMNVIYCQVMSTQEVLNLIDSAVAESEQKGA